MKPGIQSSLKQEIGYNSNVCSSQGAWRENVDQEPIQFYANAVNIAMSLYDLTLQFRVQAPVGSIDKEGEPVIETVALNNIRMSPQHAKALAAILVDHIVKYEAKFETKLRMPPNLEETWSKLIKE